MRMVIRWLFRLFLLLVVLAVLAAIAALLLKDPIAKSLAEKSLRDGTGMDARISRMEVGLLTPTVHMEGMRLYNTPDFGGGVFLDMPELRVEYVPGEIRDGKLHFKTVRLNLAEVTVVRAKDGKTNIDAIQKEAKKKTRGEKKKTDKPGVDFAGIDTLYLTVGKIKVVDLASPSNTVELPVGLKDAVGHDLKNEADIATWFGNVVLKLYVEQLLRNPDESALRSLLPGSRPKKRRAAPPATSPAEPPAR